MKFMDWTIKSSDERKVRRIQAMRDKNEALRRIDCALKMQEELKEMTKKKKHVG